MKQLFVGTHPNCVDFSTLSSRDRVCEIRVVIASAYTILRDAIGEQAKDETNIFHGPWLVFRNLMNEHPAACLEEYRHAAIYFDADTEEMITGICHLIEQHIQLDKEFCQAVHSLDLPVPVTDYRPDDEAGDEKYALKANCYGAMMRKQHPNFPALSETEIAQGIAALKETCADFNITLKPDGVGYTRVYIDDAGETQGGWIVEFDQAMKDRLSQSKLARWHKIGAISDETLAGINITITGLASALRSRGATRKLLVDDQIKKTAAALAAYNSAGVLSDDDLALCIKHFRELDVKIKSDPMLCLVRPYVTLNLTVLEGYHEARQRK